MLVNQPAERCTGDLLIGNLGKRGSDSFHVFYIMVAYVKSSGVKPLYDSICDFRQSGGAVKAIVGIDQGNTSWEGLWMLLQCADEAYIYDDKKESQTYHPKLYVFERRNTYAEVVVGSSNLTGGGLFSNYELNTVIRLDLTNPQQEAEFKQIMAVFNQFLHTTQCCKRLNTALLEKLRSRDMLASEQQKVKRRQAPKERRPPLFGTVRMKLTIPRATVRIPKRVAVLPRLRSCLFWKVAPGKHAKQWPLWQEAIDKDGNELVAIGWRFDFTKLPFDDPRLNDIVKKNLMQVGLGARKSGYVANQARLFCREIREGHIVVAYGNAQIFGIAQVVDDKCHYVPETRNDETEVYPNRRTVRWLAFPFTRPTKRIMKRLATRDTVRRIDDRETIRVIRNMLRK